MAGTKHTAGPWVWSGLQLLADRKMHSVPVLIAEGAPFEPTEGDRHLIAAAPDLLAALTTMVAAMAIHNNTPEEFNALVEARAAIAKAEDSSHG